MVKNNGRNVLVESAVLEALKCIDEILAGAVPPLPPPAHRRAVDTLVRERKGSVRLATLYFLFYWMLEPTWNRRDIPVGTRGKYGDKLIAEQLNSRGITLHDNVTAFGENLGWKGNVRQFDLSTDNRFKIFLELGQLTEAEVKAVAGYFAGLFAHSRVVIAALPDVDRNVLTFARAKLLLHRLMGIASEGHIQQFLVSALLKVHRQRHGYEIKTHHPHAPDKFDDTAGDIEEFFEEQLVRAYEVTVRDDWQNRISNFRAKMDRFNLSKYVIIAIDIANSPQWQEPAEALKRLEPYGRDIAVVDIGEFVNVFTAELTALELRQAINITYEYLNSKKLCGRPEIIDNYRQTVDEWLDQVT